MHLQLNPTLHNTLAGFERDFELFIRRPNSGALVKDLVDVFDYRFLVQRIAEPPQPDFFVGVQGKTECVLDDWFFQPTGVFNGNETRNI